MAGNTELDRDKTEHFRETTKKTFLKRYNRKMGEFTWPGNDPERAPQLTVLSFQNIRKAQFFTFSLVRNHPCGFQFGKCHLPVAYVSFTSCPLG